MAEPLDPNFSDYIIYVDESGDHSLAKINPEFPMFTLAFCVFRKDEYTREIVRSIENLKFEFWGHDAVVLHETDIRKQAGPFALLRRSPEIRAAFFSRLNEVISHSPFDVIAATIDKRRHLARYSDPINPYEVALLFCMERLLEFLANRGESGKHVQVVFEGRGRNEDRDLELEFRRICANEVRWGYRRMDFSRCSFEPVIVPKAANSSGLQLADLVARPIALHALRPGQTNRAFDLIEPKIRHAKVFP